LAGVEGRGKGSCRVDWPVSLQARSKAGDASAPAPGRPITHWSPMTWRRPGPSARSTSARSKTFASRHAAGAGDGIPPGAKPPPALRSSPCLTYRDSIDFHPNSMGGLVMGKLTVRALRAVLAVVLTGTVFIQALMVWALVSGSDPESGPLPLTPLRVITILGIGTAQVALRYVDVIIGAIAAAALVWFAVTALNAPGQRDDPGVTLIMGGIGVAILGVALIVLVLRMLLAQAVARDVEAAQMQAELDEVI